MSTSSFIRGLTAAVLSNFSTLKRQAKRLYKESPRLVGRQLTVEECQEIVAAIHGYPRWSDISEMSVRAGGNRSLSFYSIVSRSDAHEKILSALIDLNLELNESKPVVFLGPLEDTSIPAYCLWAETISAQRVPGLILLETKASAIQNTALWDSITKLGMDETAKQFRYIDAREKTLPVSISATPRGWVNAFTATLPSEQKTEFDRSGLTILLEQIIENQGRLAGWGRENRMDYPPEIFKKAIHHLAHPEWYSAALLAQSEGQEKARLEHDLKKYAPQSSVVTRSLLDSFWESMNSWEAGLGISIWHESEFRPTVVLFDRENQLSQVVAAVIHECFYGRYVMQRAIRPVLYISDLADKTLPGILEFASNTAIANGIEDKDSEVWNDITMSRALFCTSVESGLVFSGQRHDC